MGLPANSATKNSDLGFLGGFLGRWGWFRPKSGHPRWPTSVFHTGKEARRGLARSWLTLRYMCICVLKLSVCGSHSKKAERVWDRSQYGLHTHTHKHTHTHMHLNSVYPFPLLFVETDHRTTRHDLEGRLGCVLTWWPLYSGTPAGAHVLSRGSAGRLCPAPINKEECWLLSRGIAGCLCLYQEGVLAVCALRQSTRGSAGRYLEAALAVCALGEGTCRLARTVHMHLIRPYILMGSLPKNTEYMGFLCSIY